MSRGATQTEAFPDASRFLFWIEQAQMSPALPISSRSLRALALKNDLPRSRSPYYEHKNLWEKIIALAVETTFSPQDLQAVSYTHLTLPTILLV